ncbi:MAG: aspartate carbamoyltransferase regulatory subunit [Candidatus Fermentibacter sp.]|nr:aspartate carbamoyltransferase regulatory subunit [Candidatus Fermentibacter sp.]
MTERAYKVYSISSGTVIDHIPTPLALRVVEILGLGNEGILTIGMGFTSKRLPEGKDIVKIENKVLTRDETDMIALIAPEATINIIEGGKVIEKRRISLPDGIRGVMRCPNPNCATNVLGAPRVFGLASPEGPLYRCRFCERTTKVEPDLLITSAGT